MKTVISSLESTVESLSKLASAALKFSVALGSACVIIYALRIGHFPQGLALGDGLLLLLAACCFGVVYVMFTGCMVSLGICLSIVTRPVFELIFWGVRKITRTDKKPTYELAPFNWRAIPFALVAIVLIWGLGQRDAAAYWNLLFLSIALYMFYSTALAAGVQYRRDERLLNSVIATPEKDMLQRSGEAGKQKNVYLISVACVMLVPLLFSGVSGQLVDGAMRLAQVRIEQPIIYVKAPYNALLPNSLITKDTQVPEGYTAYSGTTVLFKGFGNTTVVAFREGERSRQLDIPNDLVIVEQHSGGE